MSVYLEHRLRRAGIEPPKTVCIAASRDSWVFTDIADDFEWTFPGVRVFDPSEAPGGCTLAIVPFFREARSETQGKHELAAVLRMAPDHVGFFEMSKRRLVIVPRSAVSKHLSRTTLERWLELAIALPGRIVRGGRRRLATLFGSLDRAR
jgi:hypothetical protein